MERLKGNPAMENKATRFRATYKTLAKLFSEFAETHLPRMEAQEAALISILRRLSTKYRKHPSLVRELVAMKDRARSSKKLLRVLTKKSKLAKTTWLADDADFRLLMKIIKEQYYLFDEVDKNFKVMRRCAIALKKATAELRKKDRE